LKIANSKTQRNQRVWKSTKFFSICLCVYKMANSKQITANSKLVHVFLGKSVKNHAVTQYQKKLTLHEVDNKEHMIWTNPLKPILKKNREKIEIPH